MVIKLSDSVLSKKLVLYLLFFGCIATYCRRTHNLSCGQPQLDDGLISLWPWWWSVMFWFYCLCSPANTEEYSNLEKALKCSKHILEYVNQAVKDCENHQRLIDLQRRIDKKSIDNCPEADELRVRRLLVSVDKFCTTGFLTEMRWCIQWF